MTGSDDDAPAARGPPLGAHARRSEGRESSRVWRPADFPGPAIFTGSTVRCHEDVQRHIYRLFEALGVQYRWVLTRGTLGRALVIAKDLAINDAKEASWMSVHENEPRPFLKTPYITDLYLCGPSSPTPTPFLTNVALPSFCELNRYGKPFSPLSLSSTSACKLSFLLARLDAS
jgi:hypothetical protein